MNKYIEKAIVIYKKLRIKKNYWMIAVPMCLFFLGELTKLVEPIVKWIQLTESEIENPILKGILKFISTYLSIDIPQSIVVILLVIFLVVSWIRYLELKEFKRKNIGRIESLQKINNELESAIDEINEIESIPPFKDKPKGFVPAATELMNGSISTFNKKGRVLNAYSQYLSKDVSDVLQTLHDETSQQIVNLAALSMVKHGKAKLNKPIQADLKKMSDGMSQFGKKLLAGFKDEHAKNANELKELMK